MKNKKIEDKSKKLFGLSRENLKIVIGGTGVIISDPRDTGDTGVIVTRITPDGGVIIE